MVILGFIITLFIFTIIWSCLIIINEINKVLYKINNRNDKGK